MTTSQMENLEIPAVFKLEAKPPALTERNIQIRTYGCKPGSRMWQVIAREFATVEQAKEYLDSVVGDEHLEVGKNGCHGKLDKSERSLLTNYKIEDIYKLNKPEGLLIRLHDMPKNSPIRMTSLKPNTEGNNRMAKATNTATSNSVLLKTICQELEIEPRKARMILRKKLGNTDGRWEWAEGSKELAEVKAILQGNEPAPAKKAAPKKTAAKKTPAKSRRLSTTKKAK